MRPKTPTSDQAVSSRLTPKMLTQSILLLQGSARIVVPPRQRLPRLPTAEHPRRPHLLLRSLQRYLRIVAVLVSTGEPPIKAVLLNAMARYKNDCMVQPWTRYHQTARTFATVLKMHSKLVLLATGS